MVMPQFKKSVRTLTILAAVMMIGVTLPVVADEVSDIGQLLKAGKLDQAAQKVDAVLAAKPRDAQMRFLKGIILTEQKHPSEAIGIFQKLTEDFPDLPEPYNNLAVLYAGQGQYDKARGALEAAIRTNPSYSTAHENLGDIYAKLASQAYDKALQLDSNNSVAQTKLVMIRDMINGGRSRSQEGGVTTVAANSSATSNPIAKPAPQVVSKAQPVTPAPTVVAAASAPTPVPAPKVEVKSEPVAVSAPVKVDVKPEPKVEIKPEAKPESKSVVAAENDEIVAAVMNWAKAWSQKDLEHYFAAYGSEFQAPNGQSRKAWEADRKERIMGKGRINVRVEQPVIKQDGSTATVRFRQLYDSDRLKSDNTKTLVMTKVAGNWVIKQERSGN